jgi:hypothetical protein
MIASLLGVPSTTAIYALKAEAITPTAQLIVAVKRRSAGVMAQLEQEQADLRRFRVGLRIGSETNCSTVIQVRDPMLEVAVWPHLASPRVQSTFWSRHELLQPYGCAPCSFGL